MRNLGDCLLTPKSLIHRPFITPNNNFNFVSCLTKRFFTSFVIVTKKIRQTGTGMWPFKTPDNNFNLVSCLTKFIIKYLLSI